MNNIAVKSNLDDCVNELENINNIISSMGSTARFVPYLNKYSTIKACGTIERAYKDIISDVCIIGVTPQVQNYIEKNFRESSSNPNLDNIYKSLKVFDTSWCEQFKNDLNAHASHAKLKTSLSSLVTLRNTLAHGGNSAASVDDIIDYFSDAYEIIKILDSVVY